MRWMIILLLLSLVGCADLTGLFEDNQNTPNNSVSSCEVELVTNQHGSHSTILVYASPFDELVTDAIGGIFASSCREPDFKCSLPVIAQLEGSDDWYQVIYQEQVAWVSIHHNARII